MPSPILGTLLGKKIQFAEETSFGIPLASPSYSQIGLNTPVTFSAPTNLAPLPTPGSEDPIILAERRIDEYNIDFTYRPFDATFAKYGFNAQGGGSGTIDKSLSLAMSVLLGGSTETFVQALGCRVSSMTIGGRKGGPITVRTQIASQVIPVPSTTAPAGTFSPDPSSVPFMFYQGGNDPVSIGGTAYSAGSIFVTANRNLDQIPQPNNDIAQLIIPRDRKITGTISMTYLNTDNYARLRNDVSFTLVWTIKTGGPTLTLTGCRFKLLSSLSFSPTQTVYENYSLEAVSGVLA